MHLNSLTFLTGGRCELVFDKPQGWLRATWSGLITTENALHGGQNYLQQVGSLRCLYLLNDNAALRGPWFDSLDWLKSVWLPESQRMGLRYVAHVVQADTHTDILTLHHQTPLLQALELQLFEDVGEAKDWLCSCQLSEAGVNQNPFDHIPMYRE
jgi:hypothetical protein